MTVTLLSAPMRTNAFGSNAALAGSAAAVLPGAGSARASAEASSASVRPRPPP